MRDKRYIAEHRGGSLSKVQHQMLAKWAANCVTRVLPLYTNRIADDQRAPAAVRTALDWVQDTATVGQARKAAKAAHAAARDTDSDVAGFVARATGHAVATAHMADHAPRAVWYIRKALIAAEMDADAELRWQVAQLSEDIRDLVISTLRDQYHLTV